MTLTALQVKAKAAELGFLACGITDLVPSPRADALRTWLARGYGGTMRYLHRQASKRKDPRIIDRLATRAIVILDSYYYRDSRTDSTRPRLAMYGRSKDYHIVTLKRINVLAEMLRSAGATTARPYVDTGPVPERELAERAGLGWIGKNTMLLRPGVGSWFVIGSIFTDLPLAIDDPLGTEHCGSCTRCLDACPTGAFVESYLLDATKCISYLTIEHKKDPPADLAGQFGGWAFGCDVCNEVCPWNQRFGAQSAHPDFLPGPDISRAGPDHFERMGEEEFAAGFGETPLARVGLERMRRNWRLAWATVRVR